MTSLVAPDLAKELGIASEGTKQDEDAIICHHLVKSLSRFIEEKTRRLVKSVAQKTYSRRAILSEAIKHELVDLKKLIDELLCAEQLIFSAAAARAQQSQIVRESQSRKVVSLKKNSPQFLRRQSSAGGEAAAAAAGGRLIPYAPSSKTTGGGSVQGATGAKTGGEYSLEDLEALARMKSASASSSSSSSHGRGRQDRRVAPPVTLAGSVQSTTMSSSVIPGLCSPPSLLNSSTLTSQASAFSHNSSIQKVKDGMGRPIEGLLLQGRSSLSSVPSARSISVASSPIHATPKLSPVASAIATMVHGGAIPARRLTRGHSLTSTQRPGGPSALIGYDHNYLSGGASLETPIYEPEAIPSIIGRTILPGSSMNNRIYDLGTQKNTATTTSTSGGELLDRAQVEVDTTMHDGVVQSRSSSIIRQIVTPIVAADDDDDRDQGKGQKRVGLLAVYPYRELSESESQLSIMEKVFFRGRKFGPWWKRWQKTIAIASGTGYGLAGMVGVLLFLNITPHGTAVYDPEWAFYLSIVCGMGVCLFVFACLAFVNYSLAVTCLTMFDTSSFLLEAFLLVVAQAGVFCFRMPYIILSVVEFLAFTIYAFYDAYPLKARKLLRFVMLAGYFCLPALLLTFYMRIPKPIMCSYYMDLKHGLVEEHLKSEYSTPLVDFCMNRCFSLFLIGTKLNIAAMRRPTDCVAINSRVKLIEKKVY